MKRTFLLCYEHDTTTRLLTCELAASSGISTSADFAISSILGTSLALPLTRLTLVSSRVKFKPSKINAFERENLVKKVEI